MNIMFASSKPGCATRGNQFVHLFVTNNEFVFDCHLKRKGDIYCTLKLLFKRVGVPETIIYDQGQEQVAGERL